MAIALKIHSIVGIILGLLFFFAPTTWYFILISFFLIVWGLLNCCFVNQKKYHIFIKVLAYLAGLISLLTTVFSLFFVLSTASGHIKNILIYIFFFSLFVLSFSVINLFYLKKAQLKA